ncbi:hypothetical protein QTP88_028276 [Uroleucon formosanum]
MYIVHRSSISSAQLNVSYRRTSVTSSSAHLVERMCVFPLDKDRDRWERTVVYGTRRNVGAAHKVTGSIYSDGNGGRSVSNEQSSPRTIYSWGSGNIISSSHGHLLYTMGCSKLILKKCRRHRSTKRKSNGGNAVSLKANGAPRRLPKPSAIWIYTHHIMLYPIIAAYCALSKYKFGYGQGYGVPLPPLSASDSRRRIKMRRLKGVGISAAVYSLHNHCRAVTQHHQRTLFFVTLDRRTTDVSAATVARPIGRDDRDNRSRRKAIVDIRHNSPGDPTDAVGRPGAASVGEMK